MIVTPFDSDDFPSETPEMVYEPLKRNVAWEHRLRLNHYDPRKRLDAPLILTIRKLQAQAVLQLAEDFLLGIGFDENVHLGDATDEPTARRVELDYGTVLAGHI